MDSTPSPLTVLCDMFPQVDVRIIKGAVLEHKDDIKAAIDFITDEILVYDNEFDKLSGIDEIGVSKNSPQSLAGVREDADIIGNSVSSTSVSCFVQSETGIDKLEPRTKEDLHLHPWAIEDNIGLEHSFRQLSSEALTGFPQDETCHASSCSSSLSCMESSFNHSEIRDQHGFKNFQDTDIVEKSSEFVEQPYQETDTCFFPVAEFPRSNGSDDGAAWGTVSSCSQNSVSIESLDEIVKEAKGGKDNLVKSIQDINALWSKAEQEEAAVKKAKAESLKAGQQILMKAEELRQTAARIRAINEMHAGEIFGERAVLNTEARELRLRLVQLKEQKFKALTLLNDIQNVLQLRYESAVKDKQDAEEENQIIESDAKRVLAIEEDEMSKVEQKSRELKAETEECMRLRDFLLEQGNFVDSLQGEVSVLCEDVETLKRRIEDGVIRSECFYITNHPHHAEGPYGSMEFKASILTSNQKLSVANILESYPVLENSDHVTPKRRIEDGILKNELACITNYPQGTEDLGASMEFKTSMLECSQKLSTLESIDNYPVVDNKNYSLADSGPTNSCITTYPQDTEDLGASMEFKTSISTSSQKLSISESIDNHPVVDNKNYVLSDSGSMTCSLPPSLHYEGLIENGLLQNTSGCISSNILKDIDSASIGRGYLCYDDDARFGTSDRGCEQTYLQSHELDRENLSMGRLEDARRSIKDTHSNDDSWCIVDMPGSIDV